MADDNKDPKTLLAEAVKKRDELNTFIKVLQEMLGLSEAIPSQQTSSSTHTPETGPSGDIIDPASVVYPGLFFGKSQTQATKILLERVKRPLKVKAIVECLDKGGLKVGGKSPVVNLWGVLNRSKDFVNVPKAGCGLSDWYDPSVLAKLRKDNEKNGGKPLESEAASEDNEEEKGA